MIEVRHAGAKGFGVFTRKSIPRGTRLLVESPLLSINDHNPDILAAARRLTSQNSQRLLNLSLNLSKNKSLLSLFEAIWLSFPSLGNVTSNRNILNIFRNNNFSLADKVGTRAVFGTVARINHSCLPNSQGNFHIGISQFAVHALRPIADGEEVTISYLDSQLAGETVRKAHLMEGYGFTCACPICDGTSLVKRETESRRIEVQRKLGTFAEEITAQGDENANADAELATMKMLVGAYEADGLAGRELATIYVAAAKVAAQLGRTADASFLARRGLELERDAVGIDSPLYVASASAVEKLGLGAI